MNTKTFTSGCAFYHVCKRRGTCVTIWYFQIKPQEIREVNCPPYW